jgi:hypothetical protein
MLRNRRTGEKFDSAGKLIQRGLFEKNMKPLKKEFISLLKMLKNDYRIGQK